MTVPESRWVAVWCLATYLRSWKESIGGPGELARNYCVWVKDFATSSYYSLGIAFHVHTTAGFDDHGVLRKTMGFLSYICKLIN